MERLLMQEFGKRYFEDVIYINFENNQHMRNVFEMDYDVERILSALKIESGKRIEAVRTLLIFDEIQEVPKALNALKYFYENAGEYAIVAAGSLLGIALHEGTSFPVGKVDFMTLYPLNFTEFMLALGQKQLVELEQGALTEQFVAQELTSSGVELYYYSVENSSGEVDFVVQKGNKVIPIEARKIWRKENEGRIYRKKI